MGCKSNQFEGSIIIENLVKNGLKQVFDIREADLYILNSCSVTHKSDNEAFYLLRSAKHKNTSVKTVLTGCIAQIEKEKLLENEFIDFIVGNDNKLHLFEEISKNVRLNVSDVMLQDVFNEVELTDMSKTRASLKVQDGCDNRCAYCIIWKARGKSRSASLDFILNQINELQRKGFREVVITGIHIGQWGHDIGKKFIDLVRAIEEQTDIERFRLGSLNPNEINDELLEFLAKSKKFCPHFHLSLQSACNKTLGSMNRFYSVEKYLSQIIQINSMFELPFIGSDIIVGFAGESEQDFEITKVNLEKSGLTQIHTFPYSVRRNTIGENMPHQVNDVEKERRAAVIKEISHKKYNDFIKKNIGKIHELLIEKHFDKHSGNLKGITRNYLTVQIENSDSEIYKNLFNTIQKVKITKYENGIIFANLL